MIFDRFFEDFAVQETLKHGVFGASEIEDFRKHLVSFNVKIVVSKKLCFLHIRKQSQQKHSFCGVKINDFDSFRCAKRKAFERSKNFMNF